MQRLRTATDRVSRLCLTIAQGVVLVCMATMSVVIFTQVIFRYVLHSPLPWSEELARYLMIWMGLAGASVALRQGSHVAIHLLVERLPGGLRTGVFLLAKTVVAIFLFMLIKEGVALASFFVSQKSPAMEISMLWPYSALYVSGIFMAIHLFHLMLKDLEQGINKRF
jgi:TRAP-type C4-dicarboxylate transport system permease small subunit